MRYSILALTLIFYSTFVNAACREAGINTILIVKNRCCSVHYYRNLATPACSAYDGNSASKVSNNSGASIQKEVCLYCKNGF